MANKQSFLDVVARQTEAFPQNAMCRRVDAGDLTMPDYHAILGMIFHQTYQGPSTFALAGGFADPRLHEARDYLLHHADEEKTHWQWVISDLRSTGYTGPDPRETFPAPACQAYIAFNVFTAVRFPLGRLAIATTLESIGARYGKEYATKLCKALKLTPEQAIFFFGHGDTDVGHTEDLLKIIDTCNLSSDYEWKWMCHAANTAGELYRGMYDEAMRR